MASASNAPGMKAQASQDETSPIPLEFQVVSRGGSRVSQDDTSPIPLEFQVVSRGEKGANQDETSPIPLEFQVVLPDGDTAVARVAGVAASRGGSPGSSPNNDREPSVGNERRSAPQRLKWRGVDASPELQEYAARIASGEKLPPYRGPILADGDLALLASPRYARPRASVEPSIPDPMGPAPARPPPGLGQSAGRAPALKFMLAFIVMSAVLIGSLMLGDDAQLRAAGESIGSWFTGSDPALEAVPFAPASDPAGPRETATPAPER